MSLDPSIRLLLAVGWVGQTVTLLFTLAALAGVLLVARRGSWRRQRRAPVTPSRVAAPPAPSVTPLIGAVLAQANTAVVLSSEDGRILEVNQRAMAAYGYTRAEFQSLRIADLRAPDAAETTADPADSAALFAQPVETEHRRKDGTVFPVEVSSRIVELGQQRIRITDVRDLRQRREHEAQIDRLNHLYLALNRINRAIVASKSRNDLFGCVCRALVETGVIKMAWVGWRDTATQQVVGVAQFGDVGGYLESTRVYADDRPEGRSPTGVAIREGRTCVCNDFQSDPQTLPWREAAMRSGFLSSLSMPFTQGGQVVGAVTVYAPAAYVFGAREVELCNEAAKAVSFGLDQLEAEARQRQADERLRAAFEASPDGYVIAAREDGRILVVNDRVLELYGYAREEMIGRTSTALGMWVEPEARAQMLAELKTKGRIDGLEMQSRRKDGTLLEVSYAVRELTSTREPLLFGIITDVTDARRAADALRASENRFRTLIENAPVAIAVGRDRRTLYANEKYRELFRIPPRTEIVGLPLPDVWTPAFRPEGDEGHPARPPDERDAKECEGIARRFDGDDFPVYLAITTVHLADGAATVAFFFDLSEKWTAEEALRASEERYRRIVETAQEGIFMYDENWRLVFTNQRFAEMLGYGRSELLGRTLEDIILPRNLSVHEMRKARHAAGVADVFESAYRTKGGAVVWLRVSNSPIMNEGIFTGCFGMAIEITDQKRTEQRMAEYQQRLHDLTHRLQRVRDEEGIRIARAVHDELGQQLTGLKMTLRSVETDLENLAGADAGRIIDKVVSATELLDTTVNTVQRIAAELRPSLLDKLGLVAAVRHDVDQLQHRAGMRFQFIGPESGPPLPSDLAIACYRIVQEALTNVIRHSHAHAVEIEVRTEPECFVIEVRDDGCGIQPTALNDLHSIGLLGMQERALAFGGIVTIEPRKPAGTVVRATFPRPAEPLGS